MCPFPVNVYAVFFPAAIIFVAYNGFDVCKMAMFEGGLKKVLSSTLISDCHPNEIALNPKCLPANQIR